MKNFTYSNPTKIIFGENTIGKIGKDIKSSNVKKVLMLYGKGSIFENGVYDDTINTLKENDIEVVELGGIKPNPVLSKVHEAIELARKEEVDGIIAVGGGSTIDSAKAIAAGFYYDGDIWDAFEGKARLKKALPIFTILTISATGSEMNCGGVITNEEEDKKWAFGSPLLYPKASVIDPSIQYSLPKNQTVYGAVDALSHVFELYFDGTQGTDMMDELSEGIIRNVMRHVEILIEDPKNYESRAELAWSSTLALNGMNGTGRGGGDWASHEIEHSVSVFTDVAHGAGLAIVFPAWMKYVYKEDVKKFERFAEKIFDIKEGSSEEKIEKSIEELKNFYKKIGAPVSLKEIGVAPEDISKFADNAALSAPLGSLKKLNRDDIYEILQLAYN